ncbi:MAG: MogA/MoaB family molybdenum cofactor biosynthesis protein [Thainema sp.]
MSHSPTSHANPQPLAVSCAVLTVSDTRTVETDKSGQIIHQLLGQAEHQIADYVVVKDEPPQIVAQLQTWQEQSIQAVICNGGTGIAPRDTTYDAIAQLLDKTLPGFGELFRMLSYEQIGSRALASRAIAGVYGAQLIFSLPGSSKAVQLGMEALILPELVHLVRQLNPNGFHDEK